MTALAKQNYWLLRKAGYIAFDAFYIGRFYAEQDNIVFVRDGRVFLDIGDKWTPLAISPQAEYDIISPGEAYYNRQVSEHILSHTENNDMDISTPIRKLNEALASLYECGFTEAELRAECEAAIDNAMPEVDED